jgi:hypothetical protein
MICSGEEGILLYRRQFEPKPIIGSARFDESGCAWVFALAYVMLSTFESEVCGYRDA